MSAAFLTTAFAHSSHPLPSSTGSNSIRYGAKVNYLRNIFDNLSSTKSSYAANFTDDQRQCRGRTNNDNVSRSRSSSVPCSSDERNSNTSNESVVRFKRAKDLFEKLESNLNKYSTDNVLKTSELNPILVKEITTREQDIPLYSHKTTYTETLSEKSDALRNFDSKGGETRTNPIILNETDAHCIKSQSGERVSHSSSPIYVQTDLINSSVAIERENSYNIPVETVRTVAPRFARDNKLDDTSCVVVYADHSYTPNGIRHYDLEIDRDQDEKLIEQSDFLQPSNHTLSRYSSPDRVAQMKPTDEKFKNEFHSPDLLCEENFSFCEDCREAYDERGNSCLEIPGIPNLSCDEVDDGRTLGNLTGKRVKFSNYPIRVYETFSALDYDRRNDEIDPIGASAEYELEKRIEKMDVFDVELEKVNADDNLGFTIIGMGVGADAGIEKLGIFIKSINPSGIAAIDGRIEVGDQILEVNGKSLVGTTQSYAASLLKGAGGRVNFVMGRERDKTNSEVMRLISESIQQEMESCNSVSVIHEDCGTEIYTPVSVQTEDYLDGNGCMHRSDLTRRKVFELENELNFLKHQIRTFENVKQQKIALEKKADTYQSRCEELENVIRTMERERKDFQEQIIFYQKQCYELEQKYFQARKLILDDMNEREGAVKQNHFNSENPTQIAKKTLDKPPKNEFRIQPPARPPKRSPPPPQASSSGDSNVSVTALNSLYDTPKMNKLDKKENDSSVSDSDSLSSLSRQPILDNNALKMRSGLMKNIPRSRPTRRISTEHSFPLVLESVSENELFCKSNENDDSSPKEFSQGINCLVESSRMLIAGSDFQATSCDTPPVDTTKTENVNGFQLKVQTSEWTVDDVIKWLSLNGFGGHAASFLERNVDGEKLLRLDNSKLKALGFKTSRDRECMKAKIKELKECDRKNQRNASHRIVMSSYLCRDK